MPTQQLATALLVTDSSGSVLRDTGSGGNSLIAYTPFGFALSMPRGGTSGFDGYAFDEAISGYLLGNGYRHYHPSQRRFFSPDSLSPFDEGGINAYVYCSGDPMNFSDPSGHAFLTSLAKGAGNLLHLRKSSTRILAKLQKNRYTLRLNSQTGLNFKISLETPTIQVSKIGPLDPPSNELARGISDFREVAISDMKLNHKITASTDGTAGITKSQLRQLEALRKEQNHANRKIMRTVERNLTKAERNQVLRGLLPPEKRPPSWAQ